MQLPTNKPWHHLAADETLRLLGGDADRGLRSNEAEQRLQHYGANRLASRKGKGALLRFLLQFHQPLVHVLIGAGLLSAFLREWVDAGVIFGVVLVNAVVGYIQEAKAVDALAALARTMTTEATVLRDGEKRRINAELLVPGDTVLLQGGDKVPADLRLLRLRELRIDESALTGESVPVEKKPARLAEDAQLADRANMAYASTLVTYGGGTGVVTATGDATEVGRISSLIAETEDLATPLTRKIARFSTIMLYAILALAALTVAVGMLRGQPLFDMFMAAVALAVGAIPEGLPAAVTITLAIGVGRMAKRRAIIRKLPAVETLGSTTVICTDKTGTLTENQMTVQEIAAGGRRYQVGGTGYDPRTGAITRDGRPIAGDAPALVECLRAGALCNDSVLVEAAGVWQIQGDPTEGALLTAARKFGLAPEKLQEEYPRRDAIPFESEHQYMATLHETGRDGDRVIYLKGSVEALLGRSSSQLDEHGSPVAMDADAIMAAVHDMAGRGMRVLALARKTVAQSAAAVTHAEVASGLTFLGLQAMLDPPRPAAVAAVRICRQAGIRVKMITGDHGATAVAIARQVGLIEDDGTQKAVLTGAELGRLSDRELRDRVDETAVFARATPEQKLRLVEALQAKGQVVAMTGDGVNDAPALKRADIGVAMGITGTEVAKEAAAMVLTDDNFSSIEAAVEEGRGVFDNLTKFIVWTLPTNFGEGLVILAAILMGVTLPILPVQILWINMTTAGFLGLALAFEPKEPGIMDRPPRNPQTPIITLELAVRITLVSLMLLIGCFLLFRWETGQGRSLAEARTIAVNLFVVVELCYLLNCRSLNLSFFRLPFFSNLWVFAGIFAMLGLQILYTYAPTMNRLFQSSPIDAAAWGRVFAVGIAVFLLVEIEKMVWRLVRAS
ncbi:MAG: cation-transporting P-type ATPase [Thermodesulfobacteriota bacterium]